MIKSISRHGTILVVVAAAIAAATTTATHGLNNTIISMAYNEGYRVIIINKKGIRSIPRHDTRVV